MLKLRSEVVLLIYVVIFTMMSVLIVHKKVPVRMAEKIIMGAVSNPEFTKDITTKHVPKEKQASTLKPNRSQRKTSANTEKGIAGWEKSVDRHVKRFFDDFNKTTVISGQEICDKKTKVAIIIFSMPSSVDERGLIRETWARRRVSGVKVGFIVGHTDSPYIENMIEQESMGFKDIIQERFVDTYNNLTLKTILLLKWFLHHCPRTNFLVKADEDTFIDKKTLARELAALPTTGVLQGFKQLNRMVDHYDTTNKRYVPKYMYPYGTFPPYLSGAGYFMSRDVVDKLFRGSLTTPILHLEDVFITGVIARNVGVKPEHFPGAKHIRGFPPYEHCTAYHSMCHSLDKNELQKMYDLRNKYERWRPTEGPMKTSTASKPSLEEGYSEHTSSQVYHSRTFDTAKKVHLY